MPTRGRTLALFLQTCRLAANVAQVVKLGAANLRVACHLNLFDARAFQEERAFHTDAVTGNAPYGEIGIVPALAQPDYNTLKYLNALFVAFNYAQVNLDRVAGAQFRMAAIFGSQCLH